MLHENLRHQDNMATVDEAEDRFDQLFPLTANVKHTDKTIPHGASATGTRSKREEPRPGQWLKLKYSNAFLYPDSFLSRYPSGPLRQTLFLNTADLWGSTSNEVDVRSWLNVAAATG